MSFEKLSQLWRPLDTFRRKGKEHVFVELSTNSALFPQVNLLINHYLCAKSCAKGFTHIMHLSLLTAAVTVINPILQMHKLRRREAWYSARNGQNWIMNLGLRIPDPTLSISICPVHLPQGNCENGLIPSRQVRKLLRLWGLIWRGSHGQEVGWFEYQKGKGMVMD